MLLRWYFDGGAERVATQVVCFRALRVPGSSLRDVLRGHRMGMDCARARTILVGGLEHLVWGNDG
jgi:hypothetical protein